MNTCVYMTESLCQSPETTATLLIVHTPIQNKIFKVWGRESSNRCSELEICDCLSELVGFEGKDDSILGDGNQQCMTHNGKRVKLSQNQPTGINIGRLSSQV